MADIEMPDIPADYAVTQHNSRGRRFADRPHPYRTDFDRDRDRVIHSQAFRRLEGKTQVFTAGTNDNFRNRLTHSIEVAQIGRTIAKNLNLNETLTEAICLAHDLGHPPFGHAGEKVLDELLADFGGFEHNAHTLHIVDFLEHPYPDFRGLNLLYETRLSLAKHHSPYDESEDRAFAEANCPLEGQVANVADRIAYNCHDLEDGMMARLIEAEQLGDIRIFSNVWHSLRTIDDYVIKRTRSAKAVINELVCDCIENSKNNIAGSNIKNPEDVCGRKENLVCLSDESEEQLRKLERFLYEKLYMHDAVKVEDKARRLLGTLFDRLCKEPDLMPTYFRELAEIQPMQRCVCDYIAGMTDRFCTKRVESIR